MGRVVLVTGAGGFLGARLAVRLAQDPSVDRVVAVDGVSAPRDLLMHLEVGRLSFVRADIRTPHFARVLAQSEADTVVHMGVIATRRQAGGRAAMKEINVLGSLQLLAACQKGDRLRRLVVKSSAAVYGCGPRDPAMFAEDSEPEHPPTSGWSKDCSEVEDAIRALRRARPDLDVRTLRLANVIGPNIQTAFTSYFSLAVVPTVLGFDPRLQFVHEEDAIEAMSAMAVDHVDEAPARGPGGLVLNVAGPGVLTLSQAVRRAGRQPLPLPSPLVRPVGRRLAGDALVDFSSEQLRLLTWGRVLDTRRSDRILGACGVSVRSTSDAFEDFVRHGRGA